jgi:hypothetical protein
MTPATIMTVDSVMRATARFHDGRRGTSPVL